MIKKLKVIVSFFLATVFIFTLLSSTKATEIVKKLKAVLDPLLGETDIADNVMEKEVTVRFLEEGASLTSGGPTDLAITGLSISPPFIVFGDTSTVSVFVKNQGDNLANNIEVSLYSLGVTTSNKIGLLKLRCDCLLTKFFWIQ